jgi:hypothetical protein
VAAYEGTTPPAQQLFRKQIINLLEVPMHYLASFAFITCMVVAPVVTACDAAKSANKNSSSACCKAKAATQPTGSSQAKAKGSSCPHAKFAANKKHARKASPETLASAKMLRSKG